MKATDKKKPVRTVPKGVWETSLPAPDKKKQENDISTDLQGNGYPVKKQIDKEIRP